MAFDEIVLHIGMHKTGTTAIQMGLDGYDDGQIAYADLKFFGDRTSNHANAIETIFRADFDRTPVHRRFGRSKTQVRAYRGIYQKRLLKALLLSRHRLILCGEGIVRLRPVEVKALHRVLYEHADRVRIVAYVRDPAGFGASMLQQLCKLGQLPVTPRTPAPRYRPKFKKFIDTFGRDNVEFVKYDRASFRSNSVLADFSDRVGISGPIGSKVVNESLSLDATRALYILQTRHAAVCASAGTNRPLSMMASHLQSAMPGDRFDLPQALVADGIDLEDMLWMETVGDMTLRPVSAVEAGGAQTLDAYMSAISPAGAEQLRAVLARTGRPAGRTDTADDMVLSLYRHFCRKAAVAIAVRRGVDTVIGYLRRSR